MSIGPTRGCAHISNLNCNVNPAPLTSRLHLLRKQICPPCRNMVGPHPSGSLINYGRTRRKQSRHKDKHLRSMGRKSNYIYGREQKTSRDAHRLASRNILRQINKKDYKPDRTERQSFISQQCIQTTKSRDVLPICQSR